jgi:hypothetical protein
MFVSVGWVEFLDEKNTAAPSVMKNQNNIMSSAVLWIRIRENPQGFGRIRIKSEK